MTRQDVLNEYNVLSSVIVSPGKFEGEPLFAPYFYDAIMNGGPDSWVDDVAFFAVQDDDVKEFPELAGYREVSLFEDEQGFVHMEVYLRKKA